METKKGRLRVATCPLRDDLVVIPLSRRPTFPVNPGNAGGEWWKNWTSITPGSAEISLSRSPSGGEIPKCVAVSSENQSPDVIRHSRPYIHIGLLLLDIIL